MQSTGRRFKMNVTVRTMAAIPQASTDLQRGVTKRLAGEANVEMEFWGRMGLLLTFTCNI